MRCSTTLAALAASALASASLWESTEGGSVLVSVSPAIMRFGDQPPLEVVQQLLYQDWGDCDMSGCLAVSKVEATFRDGCLDVPKKIVVAARGNFNNSDDGSLENFVFLANAAMSAVTTKREKTQACDTPELEIWTMGRESIDQYWAPDHFYLSIDEGSAPVFLKVNFAVDGHTASDEGGCDGIESKVGTLAAQVEDIFGDGTKLGQFMCS